MKILIIFKILLNMYWFNFHQIVSISLYNLINMKIILRKRIFSRQGSPKKSFWIIFRRTVAFSLIKIGVNRTSCDAELNHFVDK